MSERVADVDLERLEMLAEKASALPWKLTHDEYEGLMRHEHYVWVGRGQWDVDDIVDAKYAAAATEALPALVAEVRRIRALLGPLHDFARHQGGDITEWGYTLRELVLGILDEIETGAEVRDGA